MDRVSGTIQLIAIIILCLAIAPCSIPRHDFYKLAEEGMTSSAIVAVQVAAHSAIVLQTLAFLFASVTVFIDLVKARLQEATLALASLCHILWTNLLFFARVCPVSLLSPLALLEELKLCVTLLFFFFWFRGIIRHRA